jgi:hypothetical protein
MGKGRGRGLARGARLWVAVGAAGATLGLAAVAPAQDLALARFLVDAPTAGLVPAGAFETRARVFPGGGVELRLEIGLARWLSLGGGFGGVQIIGDGEPDWYPEPGFSVKARILEESWTFPALALGVDTQGAGVWDEERERYQFKSRGLYAVASKNYAWYGDLTFHAGLSRSLEEKDDRDVTPFVGFEKSVGSAWGLAVEYDAATNDDRDDGAFGRGRGYLNGAIRWSVAPTMEFRFVVRDMLENSEAVDPSYADVVVDEGWGRELSFSYLENF